MKFHLCHMLLYVFFFSREAFTVCLRELFDDDFISYVFSPTKLHSQ